jgi:hypothetical protein
LSYSQSSNQHLSCRVSYWENSSFWCEFIPHSKNTKKQNFQDVRISKNNSRTMRFNFLEMTSVLNKAIQIKRK